MAELALPLTGLVKILSYVAAAKWGLRVDANGRYQVVTNQLVVKKQPFDRLSEWNKNAADLITAMEEIPF